MSVQTLVVNGVILRYLVLHPEKYDIAAVGRTRAKVSELAAEFNADYAINFPYYNSADGALIGRNVVAGNALSYEVTGVTEKRHGFYRTKAGAYGIGAYPTEVVEFYVQGAPVLLADGEVVVHASLARDVLSPSVLPRAQRTAIGIRRDGAVVIVEAGGRLTDNHGLFLSELAVILRDRLNCVDAINGDGGGSTVLWTKENGVVSQNKTERTVGCAVTAKKNIFADLPKYEDVRAGIRKHAWKMYPINGIAQKTEISIHHSLTTEGSAESFANYHIDTHGWPTVAYAFVIKRDGTIQHANDIDRRTYHVGDSNDFAVGICLVGDFRIQKPTEAQRISLRLLHARLVSALPNYVRTRGHNEYPGYAWKECPCFDYMAVINAPEEAKAKEDEDVRVQGEGKTIVNGKDGAEALIIDGRAYVPIRFVSEALGASVAWNNATKTAHITTHISTTKEGV